MRPPAAAAVLLLGAVILGAAGCARASSAAESPPASARTATGAASSESNYSGWLPTETLRAQREIVDSKRTAELLSASVLVPSRAATAVVSGPYAPREAAESAHVWWEYADPGRRVEVHVWRFTSPSEAEYWSASQDGDRGFQGHMKMIDVNGIQARALPRLDIEPVPDASGRSLPGTGIETGGARIWWTSGDLGIEVYGRELSYAEPVARGVKVSR